MSKESIASEVKPYFGLRRFAVSDDQRGVLGDIAHFMAVYSFLISDSKPLNIEYSGWKHRTVARIEEYNKYGVQVLGIHGKTGGLFESYNPIDTAKLFLLNRMLVDEKDLIATAYCYQIPYILEHHPKLRSAAMISFIAENKDYIGAFMTENHHKPGAIAASYDATKKLIDLGVNAGMTIDWGHALATEFDYIENFDNKWKATVNNVKHYLNLLKKEHPNAPVIFHIPMGQTDNLPLNKMSAAHWKDVKEIIDQYPDILVVVEGQQLLRDAVALRESSIPQLRGRNERDINNLSYYGVIRR